MINDLVKVGECGKYHDVIARIKSVGDGVTYSNYVGLMNDGEEVGHSFEECIDDLEPIKLTSEILIANGWFSDGCYARYNIDEYLYLEFYFHESRLRKYYEGVDEWQNHAKVKEITFQTTCYSVHELQHALRMLRMDDIANKFKLN